MPVSPVTPDPADDPDLEDDELDDPELEDDELERIGSEAAADVFTRRSQPRSDQVVADQAPDVRRSATACCPDNGAPARLSSFLIWRRHSGPDSPFSGMS